MYFCRVGEWGLDLTVLIQVANGRSCDGMRFRIYNVGKRLHDFLSNEAKSSWIECQSFTEWKKKSCTIAQVNAIRCLCWTPRKAWMLT